MVAAGTPTDTILEQHPQLHEEDVRRHRTPVAPGGIRWRTGAQLDPSLESFEGTLHWGDLVAPGVDTPALTEVACRFWMCPRQLTKANAISTR